MSSAIAQPPPGFTKLELLSSYGPVYRMVSNNPPRECYPDEIPVLDVSGMFGDLAARMTLADQIKEAATGTGFFYIKNHGISEELIAKAQAQAVRFFNEPLEVKQRVSNNRSQYFNGYTGKNASRISPTESLDLKEGLFWQYDPKFDPETKDLSAIPPEVQHSLHHEDFLWEETTHIEGFKEDTIAYWQACLTFSRRMVRMFALCLGLNEDYFDHLVTYPGANGIYNFYPAMTDEQVQTEAIDVGLGSHTDLMCFTLLWQDMTGGLQVLNKDGQWIKATPIEGTFVVNIGDFLMRLSNDMFKSTVHRVFNRATVDRISMPFFFGFNFNETCSVLPICTNEQNPPRYEPISCGEFCQLKYNQATTTPRVLKVTAKTQSK